MVNKSRKTRAKVMLHVVDDRGLTYIYPYSYYPYPEGVYDPMRVNSIHLLRTGNPPQQDGLVDWLIRYESLFSERIQTLVRRIWGFLKLQNKFGWFIVESSRLWKRMTPVYCAEIYGGPEIMVSGTLTPSNHGSLLTDTDYLIPSQIWIRNKLQEWLFKGATQDTTHKGNGVIEVDVHLLGAQNSYLTWAEKQVKMGRKIGFITAVVGT